MEFIRQEARWEKLRHSKIHHQKSPLKLGNCPLRFCVINGLYRRPQSSVGRVWEGAGPLSITRNEVERDMMKRNGRYRERVPLCLFAQISRGMDNKTQIQKILWTSWKGSKAYPAIDSRKLRLGNRRDGCLTDHLYLYLSTEPTDRPSDVIKKLKEESSKALGIKYPYLKNKKGAVWERRYFITTVNDKTTSEQIKRYIRNQKAVAAQGTLFTL